MIEQRKQGQAYNGDNKYLRQCRSQGSALFRPNLLSRSPGPRDLTNFQPRAPCRVSTRQGGSQTRVCRWLLLGETSLRLSLQPLLGGHSPWAPLISPWSPEPQPLRPLHLPNLSPAFILLLPQHLSVSMSPSETRGRKSHTVGTMTK